MPSTFNATCTLPTVMPLPRGPSSSKALSRRSKKCRRVVVVVALLALVLVMVLVVLVLVLAWAPPPGRHGTS
jgi:small neutral amino acid transporter SnatA (MarC family)